MPDFRKLAADAKAAHEQREAEKEAESKRRTEERAKYVKRAVSALEKNVIPLLEKAKAELNAEGIESIINTKFDVGGSRRDPYVKFQCVTPRRPSDHRLLESPPIFVSSNGESVTAGFAELSFQDEPEREIGTAPAQGCDELMETAIQKSLDLYYRELERLF